MERAWQTPHGARPNREEAWFSERKLRAGRVPARCAKPPGRSLEPRSNARPRGMAVLRYVVPGKGELPCRQNSAYRSGCHILLCFVSFTESPLTTVTPV